MSSRIFKLEAPHMAGDDVLAWQALLVERFRRWGIQYPLIEDGDYGQATRAATASFMRAWGVLKAGDVLEHGLTPEWRITIRHDKRSPDEQARFQSVERIDYRAALRARYDGGGVAMPVAKIIADSNGWSAGHDAIDLICPPESPLFAIVRAKVTRANNDGWWGKSAPADPVLKARGDGIVIIQSLVTAGPIRKGDCFGYGHAEHMRVEVGDEVRAGQWIATSGFAVAWHPHWMLNRGSFPADIGRGDTDPRVVLDYCRRFA